MYGADRRSILFVRSVVRSFVRFSVRSFGNLYINPSVAMEPSVIATKRRFFNHFLRYFVPFFPFFCNPSFDGLIGNVRVH